MSVQAVREFWQKAQQDPALRQQLEPLKTDDKAAPTAGVVRIAAAAGFAFTAEEYEVAVRQCLAQRHAAGELASDQLDIVAGGQAIVPPRSVRCSAGCT